MLALSKCEERMFVAEICLPPGRHGQRVNDSAVALLPPSDKSNDNNSHQDCRNQQAQHLLAGFLAVGLPGGLYEFDAILF